MANSNIFEELERKLDKLSKTVAVDLTNCTRKLEALAEESDELRSKIEHLCDTVEHIVKDRKGRKICTIYETRNKDQLLKFYERYNKMPTDVLHEELRAQTYAWNRGHEYYNKDEIDVICEILKHRQGEKKDD